MKSMMKGITRREFFRLAAAMGGASLFAGCHILVQESAVPDYIRGAPGSDALENTVGVRNVYTVCAMCPGNCGIRCRVAQGTVVKIDGSPFHPAVTAAPISPETPLEKAINFTGAVCAEGGAGIQTLYDPFRVVKPLKRHGERGSGKWTAISWEQALNEIVEGGNLFAEGFVPGLRSTIGANGVFRFLLGRSDWGSTIFVKRWLAAFPGATLVFNSELRERQLAAKAADDVFGMGTGALDAAYDRATCVISFGDAPLDSGEPLVATARQISRARSKSPSFIWAVVDPRLSTSASKSDLWVPVMPGRDRELALGIMRCFFEKYPASSRFSREAVESFVGNSTVDYFARASGVPVEVISHLADFLAQGGPQSAVIPGKGIYRQPNGLETAKTILSLNAMVGARPGTAGIASNRSPFFDRAEARLVGEATLVQGDIPWDSQALMVWQANPVYENPSIAFPRLSDRKQLPLLVVIDHHLTETAALADYVLPDTTYLERWDLCTYPPVINEPGFGIRVPVVGAVAPKKGDYLPIFPETKIAEDILGLIGAKLGLTGFLPDEKGRSKNAWSVFNEELGIVWEELEKEYSVRVRSQLDFAAVLERGGLFLGETKIRQALSSQRKESQVASEGMKFFPVSREGNSEDLILITYSLPFFRSGRSVVNSWLLEAMPENRLLMNNEDARLRGINQGTRVRLYATDRAFVQDCVAHVIPGIRPGVVALAGGYGHTGFGATRAEVDSAFKQASGPRGKGINSGSFIVESGIARVKVTRV